MEDKNFWDDYESAKCEREQYRSFLDNAYKYIFPNRNVWNSNSDKPNDVGGNRNQDVYDNTACIAARAFVGKLHYVLTPPFRQWSQYSAGSEVSKTMKKQVNEMLQEENNVLFSYINNSNFALPIAECYQDITFGTSCLLIEEGPDDDPLIFTCCPNNTIAIKENSRGVADNVYRSFDGLTVPGIKARWPRATIPSTMSMSDNKKTYEIIDYSIFDEAEKKYTYGVRDVATKAILFEEVTPSQRFFVFRWNKLPGETFGRGVAHEIYSTVRSLNEITKDILTGASLRLKPPMLDLSNGGLNPNLKIKSDSLIPIRGAFVDMPLRPMEFGGDIRFAEMIITQYKDDIRKAFFSQPLGEINAPKKTATEVSIRQQDFLEDVGAAFGRLEVELLSRIVDRCTYILKKKGFIGKSLNSVEFEGQVGEKFKAMKIDGKAVTLKFKSPLAMLQNKENLENFSTAYQIIAGVFGQLTLSTINVAEVPPYIAEEANAPLKLFKDPQQIEELDKGLHKKLMAMLNPPQQQGGGQPGGEVAGVPASQPLGAETAALPGGVQQ